MLSPPRAKNESSTPTGPDRAPRRTVRRAASSVSVAARRLGRHAGTEVRARAAPCGRACRGASAAARRAPRARPAPCTAPGPSADEVEDSSADRVGARRCGHHVPDQPVARRSAVVRGRHATACGHAGVARAARTRSRRVRCGSRGSSPGSRCGPGTPAGRRTVQRTRSPVRYIRAPGPPERVGDEPFRGRAGRSVVAAGQRRTRRRTARPATRRAPGAAASRAPARRHPSGGRPIVTGRPAPSVADARHDRRLGRAVRVEHPPARRPLRHQFRRARLAAGDHALELGRGPAGSTEASAAGVTNACVTRSRASSSAQFGAAVDGRRRDHHRRAGADRQQQLEDRRVEARRREVQRPRLRA